MFDKRGNRTAERDALCTACFDEKLLVGRGKARSLHDGDLPRTSVTKQDTGEAEKLLRR